MTDDTYSEPTETDAPSPDATAPSLVIERTFDADPATVWRMWTDANHFARWYGPMGASVPVARFDVRSGGQRFVELRMSTPDGTMTMWFTGEFREVVEHQRLVYSDVLCDEAGNPAPGPDGRLTVTEVVVELEPIDGGRTRLVLTHHGIPADSPGAVGWNMALDALTAQLAG